MKSFERLRAKMTPEAQARAAQRTQEMLSTEGDIPIGTNKINTGQGVNNYVPPALPAQGALQRLIDTKE